LTTFLREGDALQRESAALALGQSARAEAIAVLIDWVEDSGWDRDIELGTRALGLGRSDRAREYLLRLVETGSASRARKAVEALAIHSYDAALGERVRSAAGKNPIPGLKTLAQKVFQKPR
jgi:hypothetical protein